MKKLFIITLAITALIFMNCSANSRLMKTVNLPHVPINYEVIGDTTAEETRTQILFVDWEHLFADSQGMLTGLSSGLSFTESIVDKAKKGALYKALQKIPEADKLIEPRWQIEEFSVGLFRTVTVKIWAKAIKYTKSAPITLK